MSAEHTPGRLEQEHRKGSDGMWRTEIFSAEHGGVAAVCDWAPMPTVKGVTGSYRAGNARRLTACWNACDGISTENLEQNTPVKALADRYNAALGLLERIRFALGDPEGKLTESQLVRRTHELRQKAAKWDDWSDAQNAIETDMPEGYAFVLQCSPGDWGLHLTDQDGEHVEFDRDNDTTAQMMLSAIEAAKAHRTATQAAATPAPRHKRWTPELQQEVITRHDGGESYASIGRSLGISRSWARMMIRLIRQRRARAAQGQAS